MKKAKKPLITKKWLARFVEKAGLSITPAKLTKYTFDLAVLLTAITSLYYLFYSVKSGNASLPGLLISMVSIWTIIFAAILLLIWIVVFVIIDFMIYKRKVTLEMVFPDFLQLTSANIRSGMPIDQALWHAIRPNFGVLAKEMEDVAKESMSGTPLEKALTDFAEKYDSEILRRSISLLIEGLNAGGEIGDLLNKVATNIQDIMIMQREMSASVTTYAIFITFASIAASPFMLALSHQLLIVITKIIATVNIPKTGMAGLAFSFSKVSISASDFKIFAIITLIIGSSMSAAIVSTIRKGNVRAGLSYFPLYIGTAICVFLALDVLLGMLMSSIM